MSQATTTNHKEYNMSTRLENAQALLELFDRNEWSGSNDAETIAASRYAVVVERHDDSWVLGADDAQHIADIALGTLQADYDAEWVAGVYSVETGERVNDYQLAFTATVTLDGETASSTEGEARA